MSIEHLEVLKWLDKGYNRSGGPATPQGSSAPAGATVEDGKHLSAAAEVLFLEGGLHTLAEEDGGHALAVEEVPGQYPDHSVIGLLSGALTFAKPNMEKVPVTHVEPHRSPQAAGVFVEFGDLLLGHV